jgi:hypothetical protein
MIHNRVRGLRKERECSSRVGTVQDSKKTRDGKGSERGTLAAADFLFRQGQVCDAIRFDRWDPPRRQVL